MLCSSGRHCLLFCGKLRCPIVLELVLRIFQIGALITASLAVDTLDFVRPILLGYDIEIDMSDRAGFAFLLAHLFSFCFFLRGQPEPVDMQRYGVTDPLPGDILEPAPANSQLRLAAILPRSAIRHRHRHCGSGPFWTAAGSYSDDSWGNRLFFSFLTTRSIARGTSAIRSADCAAPVS